MPSEADRAASLATGREGLPPGVTIEEIHGPDRLREVEELQSRVWGETSRDAVPAHMLYIVVSAGGILLGAYHEGALAGFVLGLLARRDARLYHASHMLGIDPAWQGRGLGAALKWAQRDRALAQGLDLMTWTFDPLEARNAHFNLHKLGATSSTYRVNVYGEMVDSLNRGLPSDRLLVEWKLSSGERTSIPGPATPILTDEAGSPRLALEGRDPHGPLSVAVPAHIQQLKGRDSDLALVWRLAVRDALSWAFDRRYRACDFAGGSLILTRELHAPAIEST